MNVTAIPKTSECIPYRLLDVNTASYMNACIRMHACVYDMYVYIQDIDRETHRERVICIPVDSFVEDVLFEMHCMTIKEQQVGFSENGKANASSKPSLKWIALSGTFVDCSSPSPR